MRILHADHYTFFIISRSFLHTMKYVSEKSGRENQNTFCFQWLFFENRTVYEKMWKKYCRVWQATDTIWDMRIARWIIKATETHKCNNVCFSTATMVAWTCLSVTLYVCCLSC